jgi:hypothetical protein
MQCVSCGHDRPRAGRCPHCGAPPSPDQSNNSYSSLRGWKDQAQGGGRPNASYPRSNTPSYPRSNTPSYPRSNTPSRPRGMGGPDQSYARRGAPGQSYPNRRGNDYDEYYEGDDERALMVSQGQAGALMPSGVERALPALPSEEEERAMGIRRPAFIPATEERRGKRAGRWRVISGVLSVMLLCVGMCGVSGFLFGTHIFPQLKILLGISRPPALTPAAPNVPAIFLTPGTLATPAPNTKNDPIGPPTMGKTYTNVNSLPVIKNQTSLFLANDTVIVVAKVDGAKSKETVSIKWFQNNEDLTPAFIASKSNCCSQAMSGQPEDVLFQAQFPSIGLGHADLYYNSTLEYTVVFDVVSQAALYTPTPTQTPIKSPTVAPTKAATPTPKK